ncbi:MAG TPA: cyclic nucleotide-binding domain-containing protein [Marmoricola sp.]|nr:cyclic nucleotide-binding domain-containing protein [Marmoricola sp.]HNO39370.1 cyclic nucleotide-binding domain-containing protein [Marmoricola sp.]
MTDANAVSKLGQISRLDALSDKDLKKVVAQGKPVHIPSGWSLMWEGAAADKAYLIVEGQVSVRQGGEEIAVLGPGDLIGEMSIVNKKLRTASVVTTTDVEALHYDRAGMERLMAAVPSFGDAVRATSQDRVEGH